MVEQARSARDCAATDSKIPVEASPPPSAGYPRRSNAVMRPSLLGILHEPALIRVLTVQVGLSTSKPWAHLLSTNRRCRQHRYEKLEHPDALSPHRRFPRMLHRRFENAPFEAVRIGPQRSVLPSLWAQPSYQSLCGSDPTSGQPVPRDV